MALFTGKVTLELDMLEAQELSLALRKLQRQGALEADLVDVRERLNAKRVEVGWLAPTRTKPDV